MNTDIPSYPFRPPSQVPHTLYNEVDPGGLRVVVCLHRTSIRTLVIHIHILNLNAVLRLGVTQEDHTRIQAPLVIPGIEDGTAVQPGHRVTRLSIVHLQDKTRQVSERTREKAEAIRAKLTGLILPHLPLLYPVDRHAFPVFAWQWVEHSRTHQQGPCRILALKHPLFKLSRS